MGVIYRTSEIGIMFTNVHITKGGHHLVVIVNGLMMVYGFTVIKRDQLSIVVKL